MLRCLLLAFAAMGTVALGPPRSIGRFRQHHPAHLNRPSAVNCTWKYFDQTIDHFGSTPGTFRQRYCEYSKYLTGEDNYPIFFYTGNESPVEEYVNNTGLMWELGEEMHALLIFAEHRYEGESVPELLGLEDCMAYCTSAQALEDYAVLIAHLKQQYRIPKAPVIAFGGSYGGMLTGWFRMRYPHVVDGGIAASAPVWGFPYTLDTAGLDGSAHALSRGLSKAGGATDQCYSNLRSTWPLVEQVGRSQLGLELMSKAGKFCRTAKSANEIIGWGTGPWFNMAEGDYPFPSTYITFSVGPGVVPLPAWPMRVACDKGLNKDFKIQINGSVDKVQYTMKLGEIDVKVNWGETTGNGAELTEEQIRSSGVLDLVAAMADAAGVWYNVTKDKECYDVSERPDAEVQTSTAVEEQPASSSSDCPACPPSKVSVPCPLANCEAPKKCSRNPKITRTFSWGPICCNEDLYLVNTLVQGAGRDIFWPPNAPRGYTMDSLVGPHKLQPGCAAGYDIQGLFGTPTMRNSWCDWITQYYFGKNISSHTNIVWSNGALDPWSAAGVYPEGGGATGPMVQNITKDGSQVALVIDLGGHHLDLFFSDPADPPSAVKVRAIEKDMIRRWVREAFSSRGVEWNW